MSATAFRCSGVLEGVKVEKSMIGMVGDEGSGVVEPLGLGLLDEFPPFCADIVRLLEVVITEIEVRGIKNQRRAPSLTQFLM